MVDTRQPPDGFVMSFRYETHWDGEWWICEVPALGIVLSIKDPGVIEEMLREEIATVMRQDIRLVDLHRKAPP